MRVAYTDEALRNLDEILTLIRSHYPSILPAFEQRLRSIERRIGRGPMSAEEGRQRSGVRVVPFIRYPYKIFYRVTGETLEIPHVHHAARLGGEGQGFCFTHVPAPFRLFPPRAVGGLPS